MLVKIVPWSLGRSHVPLRSANRTRGTPGRRPPAASRKAARHDYAHQTPTAGSASDEPGISGLFDAVRGDPARRARYPRKTSHRKTQIRVTLFAVAPESRR